jgi:uracil-DNA glycosylase family protein
MSPPKAAVKTTAAEEGAERFVPGRGGIAALRRAAAGCRGCELWRPATHTVFGEGPARAELMLVGEQPGDREDVSGHPFVGPAGRVLDSGLEMAGIDRDAVYLTNAVKHFRWKPRGKRRLHETPSRSHVVACRPWLRAELERVEPRVLVLMGAVAAQSLLGADFSVMRGRGRVDPPPDGLPIVVATVHPSSILRGPDDERRSRLEEFGADLRVAAELL